MESIIVRRSPVVPGLVLALFAATAAGAQVWIHLQTPGARPASRQGHAAAYASSTNRMLIFGGSLSGCSSNPATSLNDVWELSNANGVGGAQTWSRIFPGGALPSPRYNHRGVYDPGSDRLIVFGGRTVCVRGQDLNDVWVLTDVSGTGAGRQWIELHPVGGPPPGRSQHSAVYDPGSNRMIVFGGRWARIGHNDLWILTHANGLGGTPQWIQVAAVGGPPGPRRGHTAVYDPGTDRMIVFGGIGWNDLWVLAGASGLGGAPEWTRLTAPGGPIGFGSWDARSAVYDPRSNRMTVWGGQEPGRPCSGGLWLLKHANGAGPPPEWSELHPPVPPAGRFPNGHYIPAQLDLDTRTMIVFGAGWTGPVCIVVGGNTWLLLDAMGDVEIEVAIDVKPGSGVNPVNPGSKGVLPVAVLTTASADGEPLDFDPWDETSGVDPSSVVFGPSGGAHHVHANPHAEDVDGDGDLDMLLHFRVRETGIECGQTEAPLAGETWDGQAIVGSDSIHPLGCAKGAVSKRTRPGNRGAAATPPAKPRRIVRPVAPAPERRPLRPDRPPRS